MELNELIRSIDIVKYIGQFVELEEKNGEYWGRSPWREDVTPSFSVRKDPPFWYDFSSGKSGNVYTFVRDYKRCSPSEAIEELKRFAGVSENVVTSEKDGVLAATLMCRKFMPHQHLEKKKNGVILQNDCMDKFEYDENKLKVWESEGISGNTLKEFQVKYDPIANRIVYPIRDLTGKIVNIGGRTLDPKYKEKGIRKYTYYYKWGTLKLLYGLYENMKYINEKKEVVVFEGCKSVLIANTWGIKNCACLLTSHLNPWQMEILAKLGHRVVFALDNDVNIRDDKKIKILKNYVNVEYIRDKNGLLDPKDSPVDKGKEVFKKLYSERAHYR